MARSAEAAVVPPRRAVWRRRGAKLAHIIRLNPLGMAGGVVVVVIGLMALFAPWVATHDPDAISVVERDLPPSLSHLAGTDEFGRDVFSRVVYGARISFEVGFAAAFTGVTLGAIIGVVSAYYGRKIDLGVQRLVDIFMSIPTLVLALVISATLGAGFINLVMAIAIPQAPRISRTMRSAALSVKENAYIDAARAIGAGDARIIFKHMLPNVVSPYLILLAWALGGAILIEAMLSFLGLGTPEPAPSWGRMLTGFDQYRVELYPWIAVAPGLALSALVFGFNLFGDAVRDILDPKMRRV